MSSPALKQEADRLASRWLLHVIPVPRWLIDGAIAAVLTGVVLLSTTGGGHQAPGGVAVLAPPLAWLGAAGG